MEGIYVHFLLICIIQDGSQDWNIEGSGVDRFLHLGGGGGGGGGDGGGDLPLTTINFVCAHTHTPCEVGDAYPIISPPPPPLSICP